MTANEPSIWAAKRWEPTAPESYVLLHGVDGSTQPFKLAIIELVARRRIKLTKAEREFVFGIRRPVNVLADGDESERPAERSLLAPYRLYRDEPPATFADGTRGVKVEDFAAAARRRYKPLSAYVAEDVLPELIDRGYFVLEENRLFGLLPRRQYALTPAGEAARADLEQRIQVGQAELPGWVRDDPNRALLYVGLAGSSLLLTPMLFTDLDELRHRQAASDWSGGGEGLGTPSGSFTSDRPAPPTEGPLPELPETGGLDVRSLDLGSIDFSALDFGALSGLDSAMSSIDAGLDSGGGWGGDGGDGGGDGGAGDGGGGD
jgi:hypothetical protein